MREINEIIVHTTATRAAWRAGSKTSAKVSEVRRWHVEDRGWSDIGYHFLIDRDGTVAKGRAVERVGSHVRGRNRRSIGIALFGGFGGAETDTFADHYTPEQATALRKLLAALRAQHRSIGTVSGHNQYAAKACPCFNVPTWYQGVEQTGGSGAAPRYGRTLRRGMRGADVGDLIRKLAALGYYDGARDDIFGPVLDAAVRRYQGDESLAVDGIVGPVTWEAVLEDFAALRPSTAVTPPVIPDAPPVEPQPKPAPRGWAALLAAILNLFTGARR